MSIFKKQANRALGLASYIKSAGSITHWRVVQGECPLCGPARFLIARPDPFLTRCLKCRATAINLSVIQILKEAFAEGLQNKTAYEMSTYGATYSYLQRNAGTLHSSEYFPGYRSGEWINGVRNEDVQQLSFPDQSLDVITSNQVFEHVPDDAAAFRECWRVLRTGGALIFTVPMHDTSHTEQVARIKNGKIEWLQTPEFHASRTTGPNSVPVFWRFSTADVAGRVAAAGFRHASLRKVLLVPQQRKHQIVVLATK